MDFAKSSLRAQRSQHGGEGGWWGLGRVGVQGKIPTDQFSPPGSALGEGDGSGLDARQRDAPAVPVALGAGNPLSAGVGNTLRVVGIDL